MRRALLALVAACGGGGGGAAGDADPAAVDAAPGRDGDGGEPDAAGTCDPEAMPQPNQGLDEAPGEGGCPAGMLPVDDFCIDRHEAALVLVDGGEAWSPYWNPGDTAVRAVSIAGAVPQG